MIRTKAVVKYLGVILLFNSLFMLIAAVISLAYREDSFYPLLISALIGVAMGSCCTFFIGKVGDIRFHEGLAISVLGWVTTCLSGLLPFLLWGGEFSIANALFESVSGYTTTGASILENVEGLTKGLLFWRSSTSFIGGLGIILFVLLIIPEKKGSKSYIYRAEVSDLSKLSFAERSRHLIRAVSIVYISLIALETMLLKFAGMTFFDAICHSFSTVATSGFSTKNISIAAYDNVWIEVVISFFMLISSIHFLLIWSTMKGRKQNVFTSRTTQMYVMIIFIGILLITLQLFHENYYGFWNSLRYASFQVISLASTTGLASADSAGWPLFTIILLLYYSVQCGMVGSTAGGIKFDRIYIYFSSLKKQIKQSLHPEGVYLVKINNHVVDQNMEKQISIFIILYILTFFIATLLLTLLGIDGITALSASIATLGNVGPGFGNVSSLANYAHLPDAAKYILSANMLLGRLEIMNILALILIFFRKKNR